MERANQSIGGVYNRFHEVSKKEERTQKINKIKHPLLSWSSTNQETYHGH